MTKSDTDSPLLFPLSSGPDFTNEERLMAKGAHRICGVDEAGRGPLAGPVTAAAVILDPNSIPAGLNDSKKLNDSKRYTLSVAILQSATVSIAYVGPRTIDAINIREASLLAMRMAVEGLDLQADHALIDGNALPAGLPCPATALVKGDGRSLSIAAASIIAKVMRDRQMERAENSYPGYGFAKHKGYPTRAHRLAVQQLGPCAIHRMSFATVKAAMNT